MSDWQTKHELREELDDLKSELWMLTKIAEHALDLCFALDEGANKQVIAALVARIRGEAAMLESAA